ncbi:MAG: dihydroxy-acid dehydratase, partial [Opitutales bacterium]|nr:dihydroxy-acid dehydratase [Opitutales bacterium]
ASPEAADGGDIALIRNGDLIDIDIPNRSISLLIGEDEMNARREAMKKEGYLPKRDRVVSKALQFYARNVSSAANGAVRV